MSEVHKTDVAVIGGGPAGLAAAIALAKAGRRVMLAAPAPPSDARATALLDGSVRFLRRLGVWDSLSAKAQPLRKLRIVDATGEFFRAKDVLFSSEEIGLEAFGRMVTNTDLAAALREAAHRQQRLTLMETPAASVITRTDAVSVHLANGEEISARLVVGADGRNSISRSAAGIAMRRWTYPQSALVVNVRHGRPHQDISTEFHTREGPFTLAPLPGLRTAIVCVVRPDTAERLAALDEEALGRELTARSHRLLGEMHVDSPRGVFPVTGQTALRFAANRIALIGEAAHILPPIGAQGLNLGLRDAVDIAALATAQRGDPGREAVLQAYDHARRGDVGFRTAAVDLLNRSLMSGLMPVQLARGIGLSLLGGVRPLREHMMRAGMIDAPTNAAGFLFKGRTARLG